VSIGGRIASAWGAFWTGTSAANATGNVPDLAEYLLNRPYTSPDGSLDDPAEVFKKVPIVQQCARTIQHDVAKLPVRVYAVSGENRIEVKRKTDNLVDLLAKANPRDTGYQFMVDTVGSLILNGNAYWFLQREGRSRDNPKAPPVELWSLPAQNVRVTPTANRGVLLYEYLRGGAWEPMREWNILHFRDYNPSDEPVGFSRIAPVRREYETQFYALCLLRDFFKDGGRVGGVYTPKDMTAALKPGEAQAIADKLNKLRGDRSKTFRDTVIDAVLEYVRQGATLSEMDLEKNLAIVSASIARSIGVPPMRLGIKEGGNAFNDGMAASDAQNYWFGTVDQVATQISAVLTEKLAPLFGPNLLVEFDMRGVLPVQAAKLAQAKTVKELVGCPVLTVNEGRKMMGEPPLDDPVADELYSAPVPTFGPPPSEAKPEPGKDAAPRPAQDAGPSEKPEQQARMGRMDPQTRDSLRRRKSADLARYERMMEAHFRGRFARQRPLVKAWLEERANALGVSGGRTVKSIAIAPSPIPIRLPDDDESMRKLEVTILTQRGESALADIGIELAFNATTARASDFIARNTEFVLANVDETTTAAIQGALALGVEQNETLADIITRVDKYFDDCESSRAALIGRTETTRAYNFAANEAWQQTEGVVTQQEWLTARDGLGGRHAEDPAYAELDGQVVGLNDKFQVGDSWLAYPGDPDGEPGETCNCRCTLMPAGIDEGLRRSLNEREQWSRMFASTNGNGRKPVNRLREWVTR